MLMAFVKALSTKLMLWECIDIFQKNKLFFAVALLIKK